MTDTPSQTRELYKLANKLGQALLEWRTERGSTDGCTRLIDLVPHARVFPGLGKVAQTTAIVAATHTPGLDLQRLQFTQDGVEYDEAWLRGYSLDRVPSFNDQAHIEWLVNELPRELPSHPRGLKLAELADLMTSRGIELAPGVPIRRRGMREYLREASKRAGGFDMEYKKTQGQWLLRHTSRPVPGDNLDEWLREAKGDSTDRVPVRDLLKRLQVDGVVGATFTSRALATTLRTRRWRVEQKSGKAQVFGLRPTGP